MSYCLAKVLHDLRHSANVAQRDIANRIPGQKAGKSIYAGQVSRFEANIKDGQQVWPGRIDAWVDAYADVCGHAKGLHIEPSSLWAQATRLMVAETPWQRAQESASIARAATERRRSRQRHDELRRTRPATARLLKAQ